MSFDNRGSTVDGNSSNPNPEMPSPAPSLCKTGCGFYGNPVQEGLCSKCYKDKVKCLQQDLPSNSAACASSSPPAQSDSRSLFSVLSSSTSSSASPPDPEHRSESSGDAESPHEEPHEELQTSTETVAEHASQESLTAATSNVDINSPEPDPGEPTAFTEPEASSGKPRKSRCLFCNKKVGLTGFGCRCGGLFCSAHRYSDMHDCKFDYKEHAQDQIRKNNPVVVGKKITKI